MSELDKASLRGDRKDAGGDSRGNSAASAEFAELEATACERWSY